MRIFLSALLIGSVMSLGIGPSPALADEPCAKVYAKAEAVYNKVKNAKKQDNIIQKVKAGLRNGKKALDAGDEKTCHKALAQAMNKASKIR